MAALSGAIAAFCSDTLPDSIRMLADNLYLIPVTVFYVVAMFFGLLGAKHLDASVVSPLENIDGAKYKKIINKMVFGNPFIWIIGVSNFCIYVIRFTILEWGTSFLTQFKGFDIAISANIVASSELIGGVLGTLVAGWFTDKFMQNKAHRTCLLCTIGATLCFFLFWKTPQNAHWIISAVLICLSAFFVYGPQALLGVAASQQATKRACATANGILGIFGYAASTIAGIGFGYLADNFGWNSVFLYFTNRRSPSAS